MAVEVVYDFSYVRPEAGGALNFAASLLASASPEDGVIRRAFVASSALHEMPDIGTGGVEILQVADPFRGRAEFICKLSMGSAARIVHWTGNWMFPVGRNVRNVLTIQDFMTDHYLEQGFPISRRRRLQGRLVHASLSRADVVVVHDDLHRGLVLERVPDAKVVVAPIGPGPWVREPPSESPLADEDAGYVLLLGGDLPHKRLGEFVSAFSASESCRGLKVVHTGSPLPEDGERITEVGRVAPSVLAALMVRAGCVVMPSTYEGFGMPVLEAAVFGVPVVTTAGCPSAALASEFGTVAVVHTISEMPEIVARLATSERAIRDSTERKLAHAEIWSRYHEREREAYALAADS